MPQGSTPTPLQAQRLALGLTLREVARRADINPGKLSLYERGRYIPSPEENGRILGVLQAEALRRAFDGEPAA